MSFYILEVFVRWDGKDFTLHAEKDLIVDLSVPSKDLGIGEEKDLHRNPGIEEIPCDDKPVPSIISLSRRQWPRCFAQDREMS